MRRMRASTEKKKLFFWMGIIYFSHYGLGKQKSSWGGNITSSAPCTDSRATDDNMEIDADENLLQQNKSQKPPTKPQPSPPA